MRLVVLYGSQTGTAQDVAEQIWRESKNRHFMGPVLPLDEYPIQKLLEEQYAVFVVATTGNGDEPDNIKQTWKFLLRRSLPAQCLQHLRFACLGLGDSSYEKFNYAAKKLHKRLVQLGAIPLIPVGLCDDQHDYGPSAVALPWIEQLWQHEIWKNTISQQEITITEQSAQVFKWNLKVVNRNEGTELMNGLDLPFRRRHEATIALKLIENRRTTAETHFQDVRSLRFTFPEGVGWRPGDVFQLHPHNSDSQVDAFWALVEEHQFNFTPDTVVHITSAFDDMSVPSVYAQPLTIGEAVKYIWDLNFKPRQRAFELMALNCEDELENEKLLELTTSEGLDSLINYINRPKRTVLEVLQDFRHATSKLTLPTLFELFPIIQARSFSIASVPETGSLDLLVAVVEYKTIMSTPRLGLCSNWLKSLEVGTSVFGAIKSGTMVIPENPTVPLIMVGPGTGIAPFRSIIQSREQMMANGQHCGPIVLFFGCRYKKSDYHYAEDFEKWKASNSVESYVAFSRDQSHKIYVQDLIIENRIRLADLIRNQNAFIFVAGSSNTMPKCVKEAFMNVLDEDDTLMATMTKTNRYQEETWA